MVVLLKASCTIVAFRKRTDVNRNSVHAQKKSGQKKKKKTLTGQGFSSESATCQRALTRRSLIGSKARDAQLEFQREEYSRAGGRQESMRTPQMFLSAINPTYRITGLSLRIGASDKQETARKIKGGADCNLKKTTKKINRIHRTFS